MDHFLTRMCLVYLSLNNFTSAQLSTREIVVKKTFCELTSVSIDCGTNNVIALQKVQYGYVPGCSTQCCQSKESGDCLVNVTDTTVFKRVCSGQSSCTLPVVISHDFCSFGRHPVSYVNLEYYCIPKSRIISVCYTNTITSSGEPLYMTNPGYPGATIGTCSCSCSFEAQSCSTGTSRFIIDADLYSEPNNCFQRLHITDDNGVLRDSVNCENYYNTFVTQKNLLSNYYQIHFESNSRQNLEGYLFIGFTASNINVPFSVTCSNKSATWCIDCGIPDKITNGIVSPNKPGNFEYNSTSTVNCLPGFNPNTTTIVCKEHGIWESATCTPKADCGPSKWQCQDGQCIDTSARCDSFPDCLDITDENNCTDYTSCNYGWRKCFHSDGTFTCTDQATPCDCGLPGSILYGTATLDVTGNSSSGASATVTCDNGYQTSLPKIICLPTGLWTNTNCIGKDCEPLPSIPARHFVLVDPKNTTYGASATVICLTGYQANVSSISCLASGLWEYASCRAVAGCGSSKWQCPDGRCISNSAKCNNVPDCKDETDEKNCTDSSLPATTITPNDNNNTIIIIVLVLVFGVACLIQICVAISLYVVIYRAYNSKAGKALWFVLLSAIPFFGIVFIIRFHKTFHENDTKAHSHSQKLDIIIRYAAHVHDTIGQPSIKIGNGNSKDVEDETSMKNAAHDDNVVHHDYIDLEPDAENTDNTRGYIELHDDRKTYDHLQRERKHSDRYTELHSGNLCEDSDTKLQIGSLQKDSDQYTKLQTGNLQKDSDQYTKLQSGNMQKDCDQYTKLQSGNLQKESDHYKNLQIGNLQEESDHYTKLESGNLQKDSDLYKNIQIGYLQKDSA